MESIVFKYSSESPEKRGIVFSFLILYSSPVNVQQAVIYPKGYTQNISV